MTDDGEKRRRRPKEKSERKRSKRSAPSPPPKPIVDSGSTATTVSPTPLVDEPFALDRFQLSTSIKALLNAKGITSLFPIQAKTFDLALDGYDIVGRAKTGSGKTLAFVLPIMERLMQSTVTHTPGRGPAVLCLTPTRELANQVAAECSYIGRAGRLVTCCIYGSSPYYEQERALRQGIDFLVGTPGRIKDHINRGNLRFTNLRYQILDECDQMLQMGFVEDVEFILNAVGDRSKIQTLLFSATLPPWVKSLLQKFCKSNYQTIDLMTSQSSQATNSVQHKAVRVQPGMEVSILGDLIQCHGGGGRTIVFVETKANCDKVAETLSASLRARAIHGDLQQKTREMTLAAFRRGQLDVLVATDVAARGLDIPEVGLVIQTSPPKDVESYVHRSGRTGRAEKTGVCICLVSRSTEYRLNRIQQQGRIRFEWIQPPQLKDRVEFASEKANGMLKEVKLHQSEIFKEAAEKLLDQWEDPKQLMAAALVCLSGHSKAPQKSVHLQLPQHVTLQLSDSQRGLLTVQEATEVLQRHISDVVLKGMRMVLGRVGVIFDVHEDQVEALIQAFPKDSADLCVQIVMSLPKLEPEPRALYTHGTSGDRRGGQYRNYNRQSRPWNNPGGYHDRRSRGSYHRR